MSQVYSLPIRNSVNTKRHRSADSQSTNSGSEGEKRPPRKTNKMPITVVSSQKPKKSNLPEPDQAQVVFELGLDRQNQQQHQVTLCLYSGRWSTDHLGLADLIGYGPEQRVICSSHGTLERYLEYQYPSVKRVRLFFRLEAPIDTKRAMSDVLELVTREVRPMTLTFELNVLVEYVDESELAATAEGQKKHQQFAYDAIMAVIKTNCSRDYSEDLDAPPRFAEPRVWKDSEAKFGYGKEVEIISWLSANAGVMAT